LALGHGQPDGKQPALVLRLRGVDIDRLSECHPALECAVIDLDVLVDAPLAVLAPAAATEDEDAFSDRQLDLGRIDPRELDDDVDGGGILRPEDVYSRTKPPSPRGETRHLAEVGEKLLHLLLQPIHVFPIGHGTIVAVRRAFKIAVAGLAFLLYLWFAGVRYAAEARRRKGA
jgi:hypothetical protein